ncbi:uncharacterized protein LOC103837139 [Brassica rapa]|uniref:BnaAnng29180D protein n=3 Tax=Brassica TaxID=3705 RepID=A0A078JTT3_BRANA|nr:uncharacterized protein BNAANNG29180D [Brassica napus]XP_033136470.1 uncharacterized protein LOC103837139 [Brassica rapa]XP_033136472.1 uncharacterized protein LOC103837139 [Brassica rapa]KAH0943366.1 hypothetical protein HID58_003003 [Brassica napus]CAF2153994.1 unnamed protein product [Brassica napus]CAG7889786.1 unnamed protein product [Brassica rapa]CDY69041.1 BnaAnng29180D [Brassica napus]VDC77093.1 unnamed protein product [Brassica rapa]
MGRRGIAKVPMLLLRSWKQVQGRARISSKAAKLNPMVVHYSEDISDHRVEINCGGEEEWVPHPRTGIFFPPGQELVMDGVPEGAASFDMMFWLRNVDGVDKPDPGHHFPN